MPKQNVWGLNHVGYYVAVCGCENFGASDIKNFAFGLIYDMKQHALGCIAKFVAGYKR